MESKQVKVSAVMTAPRYEAVYARNYIEMALKAAGIPLTVSGGVFYGQCMSIMLADLLKRDVDYALTVDFDSMFTQRHIERLISIIAQEDKIDAISAIQPKRGVGDLLAANSDGSREASWNGYPIKVDSMHFGLTVIDLAKLATIPEPWFWAQPNAEGKWDGDKIDDDVYFWKKWKEAGCSAYIDPGTRLGHLEEMVSVFDERMQVQHMYPKKWSEIRASTVD